MIVDFTKAAWLNKPQRFCVSPARVSLTTEPGTDLWQRSYYGFQNDNAPALLLKTGNTFSFTVKTSFNYGSRFDQCGLVIYIDSDNWFKASIEYETPQLSRLGSVVTNLGYSDWATVDIPTTDKYWYRLSRRGPDFLIESSHDGKSFKQMRIFHLHALGETTETLAKTDPPPATKPVRFGVYACSPLEGSFEAVFNEIRLEPCLWRAHADA